MTAPHFFAALGFVLSLYALGMTLRLRAFNRQCERVLLVLDAVLTHAPDECVRAHARRVVRAHLGIERFGTADALALGCDMRDSYRRDGDR